MVSPLKHSDLVFTVVISEKGGAERREVFDRPEITVGRVQGNDLTLPKGNVSKRHARLLFRDGRFIVTDMNSTNGTYVNRRRISQATIVREGDRIYVGDFVLRIELPDGVEGAAPADVSSAGMEPVEVPPSSVRAEPLVSAQPAESDVAPVLPKVPGPPRMPAVTPRAESIPDGVAVTPLRHSLDERSRATADSLQVATQDSPRLGDGALRAAAVLVCQRVERSLAPGALDDPNQRGAAEVRRLVDEQLRQLRSSGEVPPELDDARVAADALAELLELGVLGPLLGDPEVTAVTVVRHDRVNASRSGRQIVIERAFSSEDSLRRIVARLCRRAGEPLDERETVVERVLSDGARMSAALGPSGSASALLAIRRPRRASTTLDELVRSGTISRAIATFLQYCAQARANLLIVGPRDAGVESLASALAALTTESPVIAVEEAGGLVAPAANVSLLAVRPGTDADQLLRVAARADQARLVVELASGELVAAVTEIVGDGVDGLIAVARAPGLRRATERMTASLVATRGGLTAAAARLAVAGTFDVIIELCRLRDGRQRVLRVAEPLGVEGDELRLRDVFAFQIERTAAGGAVEGSFAALGAVPRFVEEMAARGVVVETSLFTRPPSR
ncbi:MAG: FHA domain-containing protein [Sorangiineae bacterium]|nr:FHA domain-containing protein [Polyangiaceae bacterium]MEB2321246.1 FHA domain-containing protein [Sorangiineae bacterium]